jgi:hypothetical protein
LRHRTYDSDWCEGNLLTWEAISHFTHSIDARERMIHSTRTSDHSGVIRVVEKIDGDDQVVVAPIPVDLEGHEAAVNPSSFATSAARIGAPTSRKIRCASRSFCWRVVSSRVSCADPTRVDADEGFEHLDARYESSSSSAFASFKSAVSKPSVNQP